MARAAKRRKSRSVASILPCVIDPLESRLLLDSSGAIEHMVASFWAVDPAGPSNNAQGLDASTCAPLDASVAAFAGYSSAAAADAPAAATTPAGLPILNSRPGAPTAIYIDFDGDTGTSTTAYDVDGNPSTFNATEQATITEAWRQVSAYFSMFDVNITTVLPTVPMVYDVVGNNAGGATGGYAYVGTFPNTTPQAFNSSGTARDRATAIAHEVGHVFGLGHQSTYDLLGNKTAEYASETDPLHGPMMGVDYAGLVHKWIIGHPSGSPDGLQFDMQVIADAIKRYERSGGDGFAPDDYSGSISSATLLPMSNGVQSISGIIERMTDSDSFSFNIAGGTYDIGAAPDWPSPVDLKLAIYASDGSLLAAQDGDNEAQEIVANLPAGKYYAIVSSHGDYGDVGSYKLAVRPLEDGWSGSDIGLTSMGGYAQYDNAADVFTVGASGADIWNTSDSFHLLYQKLNGNGTIVAQITHVDNTDTWAKVGVMVRDSLAANAKDVAMVASSQGGPQMLWRTSAGGDTTGTWKNGVAFSPIWVKLERSGSTFRGYTSTDGVNYTLWSTTTISMGATVYVGLALTSHNQSQFNTATFEHVTITGSTGDLPPTYNSLPAPDGVAVVPGMGTGLRVTWNAVAGATGYAIDRSSDGINFARAGTVTGESATTYNDNGLSGSNRYFYRVIALDGSGVSMPSSIISAVNRPSAPSNLTITSLSADTLVLNWTDVSGDSGYRIERSNDGTNFTSIGTVATNVPSFTDRNRTIATTYYYRVIPLSSLGDGPATTVASGSTRLSAVTGLAFDYVQPTRIAFHWTDMTGETSYRIERSTNGTDYATLATVNAGMTTYTDTTVQPLNEYYYRVVGVNAKTESVWPTPIFAGTPATAPLPLPWLSTDVGSVSGRGAAGYSNGTFTLIGNGNDIWDTADAFRYVYQVQFGDGEIIARVPAVEDTDGWAKVGLMIRESLAPNARQAMVALTPGNGVALQYRTTTGGSSQTVAGPSVTAPYWLRLVRQGSTLTGYAATDGKTWTNVGSVNIAMASMVFIGMADCSHTSTSLNTSTFDNVIVANRAPTLATPANATPTVVSGTTTNLSAMGADDHGEGYLTYTWSATSLPPGAASPTFSANGSNRAKTTTATFSRAGTYTLLVTITDLGGLTTTSSVNVTVNQTPTSLSIQPASPTVAMDATQQYVASAFDQFGQPLASPPTITWSVSAGGGSIDTNGLFTPPSLGQTSTIRAEFGSISATATAQVVLPASAAPAKLAASLLPDRSISLTWADSSNYPAGFRIERSIDGGAFTPIGTTNAATLSFTDTPPAGILLYRVAAVSGDSVAYGMQTVAALVADDSGDSMSVTLDSPNARLLLKRNSTNAVPVTLASLRGVLVSGGNGDDVLTVDHAHVDDRDIRLGGGNDVLNITGTQFTFASDAAACAPNLTVNAVGASVSFGASQHLDGLTLDGTSTAALAPGGDKLLVVKSLSLAAGASLDIADESLIVLAPVDQAQALLEAISNNIQSARNTTPLWSGQGLRTSSADALHGLAAILNRDAQGKPLYDTFSGQPVDENSILVKLSINGDANLDGKLDASDYFLIDKGFLSKNSANPLTGYRNGDFNYDQKIDASDYFLIDKAFLATRPTTAPQAAIAAPRANPIPSKKVIARKSGHKRPHAAGVKPSKI